MRFVAQDAQVNLDDIVVIAQSVGGRAGINLGS